MRSSYAANLGLQDGARSVRLAYSQHRQLINTRTIGRSYPRSFWGRLWAWLI